MKTIIKPWGKEEWLELNESYCYKRIYINEGYKTSFQYHNYKKETCYIIAGQAEIWLENDQGVVEKTIKGPGDFYNVAPPKKHRVIALTDLIIQEVSTPEVDDVIRIEDDTNRADGKIEGEHKTPAVLIVCAGLGSRLKNLTKFVNKTLLPINNKAIISHIIDKFPQDYDFIITLGYKGESIKEYCLLTHPNHNFTFIEIDDYQSKLSGPGYSTLMCANHLQRPFYIIMGDCLIDSPLPHLDGNWLGGYPTSYPEKYATIEINTNGDIIKVTNKSEIGHDLAFVGLGAFFNYEIFWSELENNLKKGELVCAFENPEKYPNFKVKIVNWLDTGNFDDLEKTKHYFNDKPLSLKKEIGDITYKENNLFLKFIPSGKSLTNKVIRASKLKDLTPSNFGYTKNFIYYKWCDGKTPYEIDSYDVYVKLLTLLETNIKTSSLPGSPSASYSFYVNKTNERLTSFVLKNGVEYLQKKYTINGKLYESMSTLIALVNPDNFKNHDFYTFFHGDLHFENLIYDDENDKFVYIDWRESFADITSSGDIYYDMAKLYGGALIPYNLMVDENNINFTEGEYIVNYSYPITINLKKFLYTYEEWISKMGYDINKVKLITGLIFLNMSPLHEGKFGKMLWFKSIEILNSTCVK